MGLGDYMRFAFEVENIFFEVWWTTADGANSAPVDRQLVIHLRWLAGFLPWTVWFHPILWIKPSFFFWEQINQAWMLGDYKKYISFKDMQGQFWMSRFCWHQQNEKLNSFAMNYSNQDDVTCIICHAIFTYPLACCKFICLKMHV